MHTFLPVYITSVKKVFKNSTVETYNLVSDHKIILLLKHATFPIALYFLFYCTQTLTSY